MFILLFPMGMGILAWMFGLRQIIGAVSDQRMICHFDQRMQQWMKDGGTEEKWSKEALGLIPIMPLVKKDVIIGLPAGVVMDIITCRSATARKDIPESRRRGGRTGLSEWQYTATGGAVVMGTWFAGCRDYCIHGACGGDGDGCLRCCRKNEGVCGSGKGI